MASSPPASAAPAQPWYRFTLTQQIMLGLVAGCFVGWWMTRLPAPTKAAWRAELARNRSATLDAPFWLWSAIVELIQTHEAAYLNYCRRYALQAA